MESFLSGGLHNVLVGANSGSLKSLGRKLLVLVRNEMAAEGEVIDGSLLSSEIIDSDLGIGDTSVVSGLWEPVVRDESNGMIILMTKREWDMSKSNVRLVLTVSVTSGWSSSHFDKLRSAMELKPVHDPSFSRRKRFPHLLINHPNFRFVPYFFSSRTIPL